MDRNALALLIQENPSSGTEIRQAIDGDAHFKLQCLERAATALARIAGGGVDVVILDLSSSQTPELERLDAFLKLHNAAPWVPIIAVCESGAESLVIRALRAGGADYLAKERCTPDLRDLVCSVLERRSAKRESAPQRAPDARTKGTIVMLLGGKGGVGTTTVALNLASALAQSNRVILAELQPMFGTLSQYFHPYLKARNLSQMLTMDPAAISPLEAERCLWPCKNVRGLSILFGPLTAEQCAAIGPDHARVVPKVLSALADYVVLDLPASLSEANRALVQDSDSLLLVVERDPFSIESGKRVLETLKSWNIAPSLFGSVIVNRAALAAPVELGEIERQLGIPTLGIIPPAPDLCAAAQKAGTPVVVFESDSLVSRSLTALAERIALRH
jgi:pilus assembly protein CpaE